MSSQMSTIERLGLLKRQMIQQRWSRCPLSPLSTLTFNVLSSPRMREWYIDYDYCLALELDEILQSSQHSACGIAQITLSSIGPTMHHGTV